MDGTGERGVAWTPARPASRMGRGMETAATARTGPGSKPKSRKARQGAPDDWPVREEMPMSRQLFERLTEHDGAPIGRYDEASGLAEFLAAPGFAHESRSGIVDRLFVNVDMALLDAGSARGLLIAQSTRLVSAEGAFEPDCSLFASPARTLRALGVEGHLDTTKGHPAPDLVVEIDRSTNSRHKLIPYFRMGVREAWTWSRSDGAALWVAVPHGPPGGFSRSGTSRVLPGLTRDDLEALLGDGFHDERRRASRRIADRVARELIARKPATGR